MKNKWTLISLSILVAASTVVAIFRLTNEQLSSFGSIVAAAGSLLAVIWFAGALWYQAQQLQEQRAQFLSEFRQLREENRRDALSLSRDILNTAEARALAMNPNVHSLADLPILYVNFSELKDIMESIDPHTVQAAVQSWLKKEGPAMTLLKGIKSAAEVYYSATGKDDVDYSKEPDEFIFVYGPQLWSLPFFEAYQMPATMLAQFMVLLEPGRKAVSIASLAAIAKLGMHEFLKIDAIREDIERHVAKGYALPKIAEGL